MTITLTALQKQRRDTASNWTSNNTVLLAGEWGIESDTKKFKIGDGTTAWQSLDYVPIPDTNRLLTGNLTVGGNFTVNGTTTTVNTSVLDVEDKNISLGKVSTPSDTTADGGGITLKGATDKTLNWVNSTDSWTSSEHFSVSGQKEIRYLDSDSSNHVGFKAPATVSSNVVWTLPASDASVSGYVLASDASGNLSWVDPGSSTNPTFTGDLTLQNDGNIRGYASLQATYTGNVKSLTVTVASKTAAHRYNGSGSSNGYKINGYESPFITLTPGRTYKFDQSDGSNSGHPLRFYLEADKTTAYTTGVTTNGTPGSSGAYTQIAVTDTTPTVLHYQCSAHSLMGNAVQTNTTATIASQVYGTLPTTKGGTGNTTYTDGQLLIGNSSNNELSKATLTAGSNVTITNGNGTISIAASTGDATKLPLTGGTLTGDLLLDNQKDLRFVEADANGSNYVAFQAPASISSDITWTLPSTDAAISGYALVSDGSGTLSWAQAGGGAKGGGGEQIFHESSNTMNNDYTISTNHNAVVPSPLTINATLTINSPSVVTFV
tara:strand:+ start:1166 stop:2809 length:1644 start_codon:yes stop_codon:yes gene_type:complete